MTYQRLYETCYTSKAQEVANKLRYLNGFQTEAEQSDIDHVYEVDDKAMGGAGE